MEQKENECSLLQWSAEIQCRWSAVYIYCKETGLQTKVGTEFKDCTITTVQEGTSTVTYFLTADGYRYRRDTVTDNDKHTASVTNTLVGNAQVEINKTFPNGLLASPTTLTYTIYRNGTAIGTKTVSYTGDVDGQPFTPDAVTVASYEDLTTKVDAAATSLLPRYDASGIQYKYTVAETLVFQLLRMVQQQTILQMKEPILRQVQVTA